MRRHARLRKERLMPLDILYPMLTGAFITLCVLIGRILFGDRGRI
jgi:multidrug transporter EmrE-like cation transporter